MSHFNRPYEAIIRTAGCRVTGQRVYILDAICAGNGHTTLGEIYARARRIDQSIDRSTVYRTLKLFLKLGLIVSADTGSGETHYEIVKAQQHHHLVCHKCGGIQEIENAVFQAVFTAVMAQHQFVVETDHLVLFGVCAACSAVQRVRQ